MRLKFKLISVFFTMILAVIVILSAYILSRSGRLQIKTAYQYAEMLATANAIEIQRRMENYTDYGYILAQLLSEFESTAEHTRRHSYDEVLRGTIQQNKNIMGIWTAWLPNTIDSLDAELGQYQIFFSRRRTGNVERLPAGYEGWQDFLESMTGKPEIASPVWRDIYGYGNVPLIAVMYPVKNNAGTPVGLIGINYVSDMQEIVDEMVKEIYDGKGLAGVYANDGVIVAHYDNTRVKSNIKDCDAEKTLLGDQHNRVIQSIKNGGENGKALSMTRHSSDMQTDLHLIYEPVRVSDIDTPWCLLLGIPLNEINRPVRDMTLLTILSAVIILAAATVITIFIARSITKPILSVTNTLKDISEGEGDLTKRITNNSKDEVGDLSRYFNLTLDKIRNLIISIKKETEILSETGQALASNMNETAAAVNEIAANTQSIKTRVINQSASVSQTHMNMEQLMGNINKLDKHVENQTSTVSHASAAIEEMAANIHSVTSTLVNNSANVTTLKESSEVGRAGLQEVTTDIHEIASESEGLLEINAVMKNIASQTNLLSMNAAIEAAHAGEAGKGFAVVADEIRKLAENSGEQSRTIGTVLKKIKGSIDKITVSTENVLDKFKAIEASVKTVAEQEDIIRNAMEEQETGSQQILDGISEVNEITSHVKTDSHEMLERANEVIQESVKLEMATQEITSGMNEMALGTDQINVAVNQVNGISARTREGIDSLLREVSRFKIE
ncbi:MAG: methyl-accepting chemotaxis protein [Treponema sp.]|nr:methyl-accepting chemotaxis protein [Treponema sp.]